MFLKLSLLLALSCLLTVSVFGARDAALELNINSTLSDNILTDSSQAQDSYSNYGMKLYIYPSSKLELVLNGDYSYYSNKLNLINSNYGVELSCVPLKKTSKLGIYANIKFNNRNYRNNSSSVTNNNFNTTDYDAILSADFLLKEDLRLRAGALYHESDYNRDDVENKNNFDIYSGINSTFYNSNTIDFELGFSFGNLSYLPEFTSHPLFPELELPYFVSQDEQYSLLEKGDIDYFYYSIRYSRPLGSKSGIGLTYSNRKISNTPKDGLVYGYSTSYISPWNSAYDGYTFQLSIKTYLIPGFILNFGGGYWDKTYLRTLELGYDEMLGAHKLMPTTVDAENREENQRKLFIKAQLPIVVNSNLLEPYLNFDYTNNNSTIVVYDYNNLNISIGFKVKFN